MFDEQSGVARRFPFAQLARVPLWLLFALSLTGYVLVALWFPLFPRYNQAPLADVRTFTPSLAAGLAYALLLCVLYALYAVACRRVRQANAPPRLALILAGTLLLGLPLLLTYPINANDLYRYVIRGRITTVYGGNPFTQPPSAFPQEPFLPLAGEWVGETSPYGPLWELVAAAVTAVTDGGLAAGLIAFKALALLAHAATAAVVWHILRAQAAARRAAYTLLWAWNPALLLIFVVDGHNDALMLFWLVAGYAVGFAAAGRGRFALGLVLMALAALTKPIALLALPFFFVAGLRRLPVWRARLRYALLTAAGVGAVTLLAFLPFGAPLALAQRLLREAAAGGGFSPLALLILAGRGLGIDVPLTRLNQVVVALLALVALWLLWRTWRGRSPVRATADIFFAYVLQALRFRIWYAAWSFPWLLLDAAERPRPWTGYRLRVGLWFLLTAQLSVVIYGHLRVYALGGDYLLAHLLGVTFTFALPFLLAALHSRRRWGTFTGG